IEDMYGLPPAGASASAAPITDALVNPAGTTTTNAGGAYAFTGVGPGSYWVRLPQQAGWTQTTTSPAAITASSGTDVPGVTFGLFRNIGISGRVYQDTNGDGAQGTGEAGLAGWTVYLDANNNGALDQGEASATTDTSGGY